MHYDEPFEDGQEDRMAETTLTPTMIEYLAGLWKLENREQAMTTSALASHLGVSDTAVSRMTRRLAAARMATHLPHQQIGLTAEGRLQGSRLVRHHRLLEVFLIQVLGFSWDQVDVEAHRLEHGISEAVGDRMEEVLGFPTHCPHGDPIPAKDGNILSYQTQMLVTGEIGAAYTLRRVGHNGDAPLLRYLADLGLRPGVRIELQQAAPFKGPLHVTIGDQPQVLGHEIASLLWVQRV